MKKYIIIDFPEKDEDENRLCWWVPAHALKTIEIIEKQNPDYVFHQIVTSPGNGGYREFIIMKLK